MRAGVGECEHRAGEFSRLLEMGEMAGALDRLEPRALDQRAEAAAVFLGQDAVGRAPQEQGRQTKPVQPVLELRIMHVRRPSKPGVRLPVARGGQRHIVRQILVVDLAELGIEIGERVELVRQQRPDVDDVAGLAVADFHADGVRHHDLRQPGVVLGGDLGGKPAAQSDADDEHVAKIELLEQVEIEVGEVIDRCHALGKLRAAEARMRWRDHAAAAGKLGQHRRRRIDPDARMQEQDRPALAALGYLDGNAIDHERGGRTGARGHTQRPLVCLRFSCPASHCTTQAVFQDRARSRLQRGVRTS